MRSVVKDYEFFDQSYVEELIRNVLPDVKVNNIVPWQVTTDKTFGVNSMPVVDGVLYYGYFHCTNSSHSFTTIYNQSTVVGTVPLPYPLLFKGIDAGAINYNSIRFIGWKIMVENSSFKLNPPKPPITPPVVDGFDFFVFEKNEINPLDSFNAIMTWGKVNSGVIVDIISNADSSQMMNIALPLGGAGYVQINLPFDVTQGVTVKVKNVNTGGVAILYEALYGNTPLTFVATKPADDLILTFSNAQYPEFTFHHDYDFVIMYNQADLEPLGSSVRSGMVQTFADVDYDGATEVAYEVDCEFKYTLYDGSESDLVAMGHFFLYQHQSVL